MRASQRASPVQGGSVKKCGFQEHIAKMHPACCAEASAIAWQTAPDWSHGVNMQTLPGISWQVLLLGHHGSNDWYVELSHPVEGAQVTYASALRAATLPWGDHGMSTPMEPSGCV